MPETTISTHPLPPASSKREVKWECPKDLTRHIPANILQLTRKADGITPNDKFVMSLYWALSKRSGWCSITDWQAGQILNLPTDSILESRTRLRSLKKISIENKKISVNLNELRPGVLSGGRTIRDCFMRAFKDATQRMVAETEMCRFNNYVGWRAWHLGISKITYQKAKQGWNETGELGAIIGSFGLEENWGFYTPKTGDFIPPKLGILYPIRRDLGEVKESRLSKDSLNGAMPLSEGFKIPHMEDSMQQPQEINYKKYTRSGKDVRPLTREEQLYKRNTELENEVFRLPNLATQKFGLKSYDESAKAITRLKHGLEGSKPMSNGGREMLTKSMLKYGLTQQEIDSFLAHKFILEERKRLYQLLNLYHDKAYTPEKKTGAKDLAGALFNSQTGYCLLMMLWFKPPKPKGKPTPKITSELEKAVTVAKEKIPNAEHNYLVRQLEEMKVHWDSNTVPRLSRLYKTNSTFEAWLGQFLDFAYNKATKDYPLHAGWLNPGFWAFLEWEKAWMTEMEFQSDQKQKGDASRKFWEREKIIQEIRDKMDANNIKEQLGPEWGYDPELTAEAYRLEQNI